MGRTLLRIGLLMLLLAAVAGCGNERRRANVVRSSCPNPIEGFAELVEAQAEESGLFPTYELTRLGPERRTRSESRFACEIVLVDNRLTRLVQQVVVEYYLTEADAILGLRYSELSEFDDAVGSVDRGFPRVIAGTYSQSRHHTDCIVIRALWRNTLAVAEAPTAQDRDDLVREAFPDVRSLCETHVN